MCTLVGSLHIVHCTFNKIEMRNVMSSQFVCANMYLLVVSRISWGKDFSLKLCSCKKCDIEKFFLYSLGLL